MGFQNTRFRNMNMKKLRKAQRKNKKKGYKNEMGFMWL